MVEVWNGSNWDWMSPNQPITGVALAIGNLRKNVVEESRASSNLSILSVINDANGRGITGESATGIGVYGFSHTSTGIEGYSPNWRGVYGHSDSNAGVYGESAGNGSAGVSAINSNTPATAYGVTGAVGQSWWVPYQVDTGVTGSAESWQSIGVFGFSTPENNGLGVVGVADSTVYWIPPDGSAGLVGTGDYGVYATANDTTNGWAGCFWGNTYTSRDIYAGGTKYSVMDTSQGKRSLAAIESPEVWLEDLGTATLIKGKGMVQ